MVAALAKTARIFYHTWRENPTSICQAVAPRVFSNFTDAELLLDLQEETEAVNHPQDSREQKSILRAKRLLLNASCASAAVDNWVSLCQIHEYAGREEHRGEDPYMRPSEVARFEHAFYCVWAIGVMGKAPHLQNQASAFLDKCTPRELYSLYELGTWAKSYNDNEFGSLGLDLQDEVWKTSYDIVSKRWEEDGRPLRAIPDSSCAPLNFFAFFDHTQRYLDLIQDE